MSPSVKSPVARIVAPMIALASALLFAIDVHADIELTDIELKWLNAADPVLAFANDSGLPVDIVIVPKSDANDVPLSMGVRDGRCKLAFSLRDNPDAEKTLEGVDSTAHALFIEAMTAHEIAHCWRFIAGEWHTVPAGFIDATLDGLDNKELRAKRKVMRATQREEGFADLVALAWIARHRPEDYAATYTWLQRVRQAQPLAGSFHDTRPWLALAKDKSSFSDGDSLFDQVHPLWVSGLRNQ